MQIGIGGIGKMGAAIAQRLIEVGHTVTVWNRSADKLKPVAAAGAAVAATPAELAKHAEAVITILTDAAAIDAVYTGASGLLAPDVRGKLFIEMSTVPPQAEVALAEKVRAKGATLVECPVGGSTGPARQGKLIGLMGAEPADAARAKPILEQLCRRLEHCGPVGTGAVMKLTINMPLMIYWQALGEALALCRPLGLAPARIMDLLADTSGGPNVLKVRGPGVAQMLKGGDAGPVTFDVDSAVKDLRTMVAEGKARGVELPLTEKTLACYEETKRNVSGAAEVSAVSAYWANRAMQRSETSEPTSALSRYHVEPICLWLRLLKPRPSSMPRSTRAATPTARRSPSPFSTRAVTSWRSSAGTSRACCVSISHSARPGARSAWASARARWLRERPRRRSSSPCW